MHERRKDLQNCDAGSSTNCVLQDETYRVHEPLYTRDPNHSLDGCGSADDDCPSEKQSDKVNNDNEVFNRSILLDEDFLSDESWSPSTLDNEVSNKSSFFQRPPNKLDPIIGDPHGCILSANGGLVNGSSEKENLGSLPNDGDPDGLESRSSCIPDGNAFSSLFTSNCLMSHFSSRQITCAAAILGSTLTLLLSQSPNVLCVLIVFGFKGLCFGALLVCPTSLLGFYFKRRIALATAISNTGLCAAFILFPGLIQMLREEYGLRGALLILAALELHILVMGMLLRPVDTYRKLHQLKLNRMLVEPEAGFKTKERSPHQELFTADGHKDSALALSGKDELVLREKETPVAKTRDDFTDDHSNRVLCNATSSSSCNYKSARGKGSALTVTNGKMQEVDASACAETRDHFPVTQAHTSGSCREATGNSDFQNYYEIPAPRKRKDRICGRVKTWIGHCSEKRNEDGDHELECLQKLKEVPRCIAVDSSQDSFVKTKSVQKKAEKGAIFDTSLLQIWPFRMILLANGLGTFTSFVNIYMPTVAVQAGLTKGQAASLLTVVGTLDLCSRVILGYVADTGVVAKTKIVSVCLACIAVVCQLNRFYQSYVQFLVYAACVGLTCGCRHNLLNVILIDHLGVDRLAKGLGLCSLLNTALLAANHITIGLLLDATGSFVIPMHFVGSVVLVGSLLYFAEPLFVRLEKKRKAREEQG